MNSRNNLSAHQNIIDEEGISRTSHMMEFYSKTMNSIHATTWMSFGNIMEVQETKPKSFFFFPNPP